MTYPIDLGAPWLLTVFLAVACLVVATYSGTGHWNVSVAGQADVVAVMIYPAAFLDVILLWRYLPHVPPGVVVSTLSAWGIRTVLLVFMGRRQYRITAAWLETRRIKRITRKNHADIAGFLGPYTPADAERLLLRAYGSSCRAQVSPVPGYADMWVVAVEHDEGIPPFPTYLVDRTNLHHMDLSPGTRPEEVTERDVILLGQLL